MKTKRMNRLFLFFLLHLTGISYVVAQSEVRIPFYTLYETSKYQKKIDARSPYRKDALVMDR